MFLFPYRTIAVGSELHFDGTLSTDFDNSKSALTYQWSCVEVIQNLYHYCVNFFIYMGHTVNIQIWRDNPKMKVIKFTNYSKVNTTICLTIDGGI